MLRTGPAASWCISAGGMYQHTGEISIKRWSLHHCNGRLVAIFQGTAATKAAWEMSGGPHWDQINSACHESLLRYVLCRFLVGRCIKLNQTDMWRNNRNILKATRRPLWQSWKHSRRLADLKTMRSRRPRPSTTLSPENTCSSINAVRKSDWHSLWSQNHIKIIKCIRQAAPSNVWSRGVSCKTTERRCSRGRSPGNAAEVDNYRPCI